MPVRRNSRRNEDAMGIRFQDPCERARAAEAEVLMEPEMQFYGYRTYRARDLEVSSILGALLALSGQPATSH
jgi:hypothetical protein